MSTFASSSIPADLQTRFEQAQQSVQSLTQRPSNQDLLRLYAHYKQASAGDCTGERPGAMDFVNRAKFDAWKALQGSPSEEAMQTYIDLVDDLLAADKD